jgi:Na+-transporting NADH:ubiquinone oxidoreductase subunit F
MIKKISSKISGRTQLTPDTFFLDINFGDDVMICKPGQFVTLCVPIHDKPGKYNRAYSIAGYRKPILSEISTSEVLTSGVKLLIRSIPDGKATSILRTTSTGSEIDVIGPQGKLVPDAPKVEQKDGIVFCASATGIAPFLSFIEYYKIANYYPKIKIFFGVRSLEDLHLLEYFEENIKKWEVESSSLEVLVCVSRCDQETLSNHKHSSLLHSGRINKYLERSLANSFDGYVYICGGKDFVTDTKDQISETSPSCKIVVESFF